MLKIKEIRKNTGINLHTLPDILKVDDIAQFLKVSKRTVYNWIEYGELKAYRFGLGQKGCIRVFKEDFISFINSRKPII